MGEAVDMEVDDAFPLLRRPEGEGGFAAKLVEVEAEETPGDPVQLKTDIILAAKDIGVAQTGRAVDYRWCFDTVRQVARKECSIVGFDMETESDVDTLKYVLKSVRRALWLAKPQPADADDDIPF